jgi:hypothetical protein
MLPFEGELPAGGRHYDASACRSELAPIERIPATSRLTRHRVQIHVDRGARHRMPAEAQQLRMVTIAFGRTS